MAPGGGGNIKVVVRVRPFNNRGELVKYVVTRCGLFLQLTGQSNYNHRMRQRSKMYRADERNPDHPHPTAWQ